MAWGARNLISTQEYWTYGQRDAIERARRRGVHLNFWSANEAYWAVRFEGRNMICYKETQNVRKLDRHDVRTGARVRPRGASMRADGVLVARKNSRLRLQPRVPHATHAVTSMIHWLI